MRDRHSLLVACALLAALAVPSFVTREASAAPGAAVQDATPAQKKEAQAHYEKGAKLFEQKKFAEARDAFQASYDVVASPNAHMMLARSLIESGDPARAYRELGVAEEEAKSHERYAATLEKVRSLRTEVKPAIALVRVTLVGAAPSALHTVRIGDASVAQGEVRAVMPGLVRVEVLDGTTVMKTQDVELTAGTEKTVSIDVTPPPPPPVVAPVVPPPPVKQTSSSSRTVYLVSGGIIGAIGLAGIGAGTGLYLMAKNDHQELQDACGSGGKHCPPGSDDQIEDGRDRQAWGVIAWVAGGATTSLGVGLLIAGLTKSDADEPDDVAVDVGPGWVGVRARF